MKPNLATFPKFPVGVSLENIHPLVALQRYMEATEKWKEEFGGALRHLFEQKRIKIDKLPNTDEVLTMTKRKMAEDFNREITELERAVLGDAEASP